MTTETRNQPARLTAIELENFKGVGTRVRVELKPITLLFGANSAGKSTILQALQYAREVLERRNANPDRTLYGGDFVDLGGFRNLVHQRKSSSRISVKLDLTLNSAGLPDLVPEAFEDWQNLDDEVWAFYNLLQGVRNRIETLGIQLEVGWNADRKSALVTRYEVHANGAVLASIEAQHDGRDASIRINPRNSVFIRELTQEEIETTASLEDLLPELSNDEQPALQEPAESLSSTGPDETKTTSTYFEILAMLEEAGIEKPGQGFRQWLTGQDGALPKLEPLLYSPSGKARGATAVYIAREFTAFLSSILVGPAIMMRDQLRGLRYLGPIRHVPHREFDAALTPDEARWADGLAAWECLMTGDDKIVRQVSTWMSEPDKLGTGYEVERREVAELGAGLIEAVKGAVDGAGYSEGLTKELESLRTRPRLELIESHTGLRAQPRDVGIGISQVLPVVVAALEPSATLVVIEQPELHVHPAVQVGLGDLFVRAATDNGSLFLIETHSEHLILRLLRRIRETTEGELPPGLPPLGPEQVGVVYVERGEAGVKLTAVPIDKSGEFTSRWPAGFFEERAGELF